MLHDRIVSAWMLRPRRAKLVKEHSAAVRRLVEIDVRTAYRTVSVWIDVARICDERELENFAVKCRSTCRTTTSATITAKATKVAITTPTTTAIRWMIPCVAHDCFVLLGFGFGRNPVGDTSWVHAAPPKKFSTFAFTAASILMSGGQGRLKPSPGIFFVASRPSLLPMAISRPGRARRTGQIMPPTAPPPSPPTPRSPGRRPHCYARPPSTRARPAATAPSSASSTGFAPAMRRTPARPGPGAKR